MANYTAQIRTWNDKTRKNTRNIIRTATQDLMTEAQHPVAQGGSMPVDIGVLRNSLASGVNGSQIAKGSDSYTLAVAKFNPGDVASFGWTADYAAIRHYKPEDFGQGGGMWRDKAAAKWQSFVDNAVRKFSA